MAEGNGATGLSVDQLKARVCLLEKERGGLLDELEDYIFGASAKEEGGSGEELVERTEERDRALERVMELQELLRTERAKLYQLGRAATSNEEKRVQSLEDENERLKDALNEISSSDMDEVGRQSVVLSAMASAELARVMHERDSLKQDKDILEKKFDEKTQEARQAGAILSRLTEELEETRRRYQALEDDKEPSAPSSGGPVSSEEVAVWEKKLAAKEAELAKARDAFTKQLEDAQGLLDKQQESFVAEKENWERELEESKERLKKSGSEFSEKEDRFERERDMWLQELEKNRADINDEREQWGNELRETRKKLLALQQEYDAYKQEFNEDSAKSLTDSQSDLSEELEATKSRLRNAEEELEVLTQLRDRFDESMVLFEEEKKSLQQQLDLANAEQDKARREATESSELVKKLRTELAEKTEQLEADLRTIRQKSDGDQIVRRDFEDEKAELTEKIRLLEIQVGQLKGRTKELKSDRDELESKINTEEGSLSELDSEKSQLLDRLAALEASGEALEKARQELSERSARLEQEKRELSQSLEDEKWERKLILDTQSAKEAEIIILKDRIATLTEEREAVRENMRDLENGHEEDRQSLLEKQRGLEKRLQILLNEIDDQIAKNEELESESAEDAAAYAKSSEKARQTQEELETEREALRAELGQARHQMKELQEQIAAGELDQSQKQALEDARAEFEDHQKKVEEDRRKKEESLEEERDELREKLGELKELNTSLKFDRDKFERQLKDNDIWVAQLESERDEVKEKLETRALELESSKSRVHDFNLEIEEYKEQCLSFEAQVELLGKEKEGFKKALDTERTFQADLHEQNSQLKDALDALSANHEATEKQRDELSEKAANLTEKVGTLEGQLKESQANLEAQSASQSEVDEAAHSELKEELEAALAELNEARLKNEEFEQKMEDELSSSQVEMNILYQKIDSMSEELVGAKVGLAEKMNDVDELRALSDERLKSLEESQAARRELLEKFEESTVVMAAAKKELEAEREELDAATAEVESLKKKFEEADEARKEAQKSSLETTGLCAELNEELADQHTALAVLNTRIEELVHKDGQISHLLEERTDKIRDLQEKLESKEESLEKAEQKARELAKKQDSQADSSLLKSRIEQLELELTEAKDDQVASAETAATADSERVALQKRIAELEEKAGAGPPSVAEIIDQEKLEQVSLQLKAALETVAQREKDIQSLELEISELRVAKHEAVDGMDLPLLAGEVWAAGETTTAAEVQEAEKRAENAEKELEDTKRKFVEMEEKTERLRLSNEKLIRAKALLSTQASRDARARQDIENRFNSREKTLAQLKAKMAEAENNPGASAEANKLRSKLASEHARTLDLQNRVSALEAELARQSGGRPAAAPRPGPRPAPMSRPATRPGMKRPPQAARPTRPMPRPQKGPGPASRPTRPMSNPNLPKPKFTPPAKPRPRPGTMRMRPPPASRGNMPPRPSGDDTPKS